MRRGTSTNSRSTLLVLLFGSVIACKPENRVAQVKEVMSEQDGNILGLFDAKRPLADLPLSGALRRQPWSGYYWPHFRGGIGGKMLGISDSPAEKLAKVFPLSPILKKYAVLKPIPNAFRWEGICNGVALASTLVDVPDRVAVYKGIRFFPHEIKALASQMIVTFQLRIMNGEDVERSELLYQYFGLGERYEVDKLGRPIDSTVRDTNPGAFHLALTQLIGVLGKPLFADMEVGPETLIYPIFAFESKIIGETFSPRELQKLKQLSPSAARFVKVQTVVSMADSHTSLVEPVGSKNAKRASLAYTLELDSKGQIIGGEWEESKHPDFVYFYGGKTVDWTKLPGGSELQEILNSPAQEPYDPTPFLRHPDAKVSL